LTQYQAGLDMTRAALGDEAFHRAWTAGRALPLDDAVREALSIAEEIAQAAGVTA
jgi:hypothetical protein